MVKEVIEDFNKSKFRSEGCKLVGNEYENKGEIIKWRYFLGDSYWDLLYVSDFLDIGVRVVNWKLKIKIKLYVWMCFCCRGEIDNKYINN